MRILVVLFGIVLSQFSLADSISIEVENDAGTPACEYLYNLDSEVDQKLNFCSSRQDARCLIDFSIEITRYNLQEHYGLSSFNEGGLSVYCEKTPEFISEVLSLTVLAKDIE